MLVTSNWINEYLQEKISAEEQAELLTNAGFPLENTEMLPDGDTRQDFEMTSNRGDCTCHIGLAREIAASSNNTLIEPQTTYEELGPPVEEIASVMNEETDACPLYAAKLIQNISVKDSPDWLSTKIENRGDTTRNAIVDTTNFVLFELGQPTHIFDFDKVEGGCIIIRFAKEGEEFLPLGENAAKIKLSSKDLVIADAAKPIALAGVKGGAETAVTTDTKNILVEVATFDPVTVRNSSRRHKITSDSSFRFERGVSPLQIDSCTNRLMGLLLEVGGGQVCSGTLKEGKALPEQRSVAMCPERCRERLGVDIKDSAMQSMLDKLGFSATVSKGMITCTVPYFRGDIEREIDLIEEVGRVYGYQNIPIVENVEVSVPQFGGESDGRKAILDALAGMNFVECTTHSLISEDAAKSFLTKKQGLLTLEDDRTAAEPALRPSILPSLLTVRKHNADNSVKNLRLAELGSIFTLEGDNHNEKTELAIAMDAEENQGINELRGVIDHICMLLTHDKDVTVETCNDIPWLQPGGSIKFGDEKVGYMGRLSQELQKQWDLSKPLHVAQLYLAELMASYPPDIESTPLPKQPAIDRDLSLVVDEEVLWSNLKQTIVALSIEHLENIDFVTTFRNEALGKNKKSITIRLRFRDLERTLTHEEVHPQIENVTQKLIEAHGAEIRS